MSSYRGPLRSATYCFCGVHMKLYHSFLLLGEIQTIDLDDLLPAGEMSVYIFTQIIQAELLVQNKLIYVSGCYHISSLQSRCIRKNQDKKTKCTETQ